MTDREGVITVEVVYALPERQKIVAVEVPPGSRAIDAVRLSGIAGHFEELVVDDALTLGIFGQVVPGHQVLAPGDRVEIYRPLKADPKAARKARARRAGEG